MTTGNNVYEHAYSRLQEFHNRLLESNSATEVLDEWCGSGRHGGRAEIRAQRFDVESVSAPSNVLSLLGIQDEQFCSYRHVRLVHDGVVLSDAENWYVPAELSAEMNLLLEQSDAPFGYVVQPLGFQRRTLATEFLLRPSPLSNVKVRGPEPDSLTIEIPEHLLRHRTLLLKPCGTPFSFVVETYTRNILQY